MTSSSPAVAVFDLDTPWRLHPQVAVRPERFGAMLYHFGTRRLSFCKDPKLTDTIELLASHVSARAALAAAGVSDNELPTYERALATLAHSRTIVADGPAT